jgi:hypothetical protein
LVTGGILLSLEVLSPFFSISSMLLPSVLSSFSFTGAIGDIGNIL